jgi:hypothetical protein
MAKILTNVTGMHEHYLSCSYTVLDFQKFAVMNITAAGTVVAQTLSGLGAMPIFDANSKLFVHVDSISDISTNMLVTVKSGPTTGATRVTVTAGGTGYTNGSAVTFATNNGFAGTAVVVAGVVTDVIITNGGTTLPVGLMTVAGGGTGATGTPVAGTGLALGTATVVAHSPIDAIFPVKTSGDLFTVAPGYGFTVDLATATAGVVLNLLMLDDSPAKWFDMGLNYNEGLTFEDGAMIAPVARGWNMTDHAKRVPNGNQWSLSQLYCSQFEGVANLRGKTIMIKDEVKTDGSSIVKETAYITKATVQNAAQAIGGGGGGAAADAVHANGYYARSYTWTLDATSLTATQ